MIKRVITGLSRCLMTYMLEREPSPPSCGGDSVLTPVLLPWFLFPQQINTIKKFKE